MNAAILKHSALAFTFIEYSYPVMIFIRNLLPFMSSDYYDIIASDSIFIVIAIIHVF